MLSDAGVHNRLSIALLSHLASPRAPTGAERSLALLATGLAERGHRVAVVAPGAWSLRSALVEAGVEVRVVPSRPSWTTYHEPRPIWLAAAKWVRGLASRFSARRIGAFLAEWQPDVVHVNCLPHLAGALAAHASLRPVAWHVREVLPEGPRRRAWSRQLARHATAIVAVSEAVGEWIRAEGLGDRLHVVHNGIACPPGGVPGDGREARKRFGIPPDGVLVGLYGQLVPHKGARSFLDAADRALALEPGLRFALAGDGPRSFLDELLARIAASPGRERFHLLPPQSAGGELIRSADVVCLATTTPDPLPRVVLEAMAAARPVAAFRSGGTPEMVVSEGTGLLVPSGDASALAEAFVRLARDAGLRASMGVAGARRVREKFSLERHLDRMEQILIDLTRGSGAAAGAR